MDYFGLHTTVSAVYRSTKNGLTFKLATCCICLRKQYITYCTLIAPCLCVLCCCELHGTAVEREKTVRVSLKPVDAGELRLIRPSGWWQQVGSCGDFVNLYLRASREDRQAHKDISARAEQSNNASFRQSCGANFTSVLFFWGQNERP